MERAERLTALGLLARVAVADLRLGVLDGDEAVGAADGVAVERLRKNKRRENRWQRGGA